MSAPWKCIVCGHVSRRVQGLLGRLCVHGGRSPGRSCVTEFFDWKMRNKLPVDLSSDGPLLVALDLWLAEGAPQ